ncbi:zinc finger BED domain-containing protein 1-like [Myzus persicae]|uniref:zinc finger BED domain-containing protein 1-like n=1 Tax=Myzus persicae TaxID=13164 RepID=UPI000B930193|nr:zinc finger BED domain-containing protein 1-like [Myzus persicae]
MFKENTFHAGSVFETCDVDDPDEPDFVVNKSHETQTTLNFVAVETSPRSGIEEDSFGSFSGSRASTPTATSTSVSSNTQSMCLRQKTMFESFLDIKSYDRFGHKTRSITNALTYMIAKDNMPLSTTEKEGFKYFMRKAEPMYKLPSRNTTTNLIKSKYEVLSNLIKSKISVIDYLTLTSDIWTDTINTKSFLGITVHYFDSSKVALDSITIGVLELSTNHPSENISIWFEQLLADWGINKTQVFTVVTDNGSNILGAVKKTFTPEKHFPCFAHTLNLVSGRTLGNLADVQQVINKIKFVVTYFKHSVVACDELKKLCNLKLKQSVPTRWNSIYYMIDRFISCSNHIASVLINIRGGPIMLTAEEIDLAKEIVLVLRPMKVATKELCGQKYVTCSKVIPLINCLIKKTEGIFLLNPIALSLKNGHVRESRY